MKVAGANGIILLRSTGGTYLYIKINLTGDLKVMLYFSTLSAEAPELCILLLFSRPIRPKTFLRTKLCMPTFHITVFRGNEIPNVMASVSVADSL